MNKKVKYISVTCCLLTLLISTIIFNNYDEVSANEIENNNNNNKTIFVDLKGAVINPGVYEMDKESRIIDVINEAGGLKDNADTTIINLSKKVEDEMFIIIYTYEQTIEYKNKLIPPTKIITELEEKIICPDENNDACINQNYNSSLININSASKEELLSIPGIGETRANNIINYRNEINFNNIEDIKNVNGIGDSLYEKIKEYITV